MVAGELERENGAPATGSKVPTSAELRARWTCNCERLGLVQPRTPGSHTLAAVLCPDKVKAGEGADLRVGDVTEVLVPAMRARLTDEGVPKGLHTLWMAMLEPGRPPGLITWALCLKARQVPNPLWGVLDEDQRRDKSISRTILVPQPWESWAIRAPDVRGTWAGWSGEPAKPEAFRIRDVDDILNYTEAMRIIKSK